MAAPCGVLSITSACIPTAGVSSPTPVSALSTALHGSLENHAQTFLLNPLAYVLLPDLCGRRFYDFKILHSMYTWHPRHSIY